VLWWNANHDWISILYQLNHGTHNDDWQWQRVLNTQLAQLGVYSIALFGIGLWVMFSAWWQPTHSTGKLLSAFALPIIVLFAMNSGYEMSLPHWTQLAWLFIAPAVAFWIWQGWHKAAIRWLVYISSGITLSVSILLNSQLATPWLPLPDNENIVQELHGWPEAVAEAKKQQTDFNKAPLFAANWTQASRIAWYAQQPVYVTDNRFDQFDLWFGNPPAGQNGIVIIPHYEPSPPKQGSAGQFQQCLPLSKLPIKKHDITIVTYSFYYCEGFQPPIFEGWVTELPMLKQNQ